MKKTKYTAIALGLVFCLFCLSCSASEPPVKSSKTFHEIKKAENISVATVNHPWEKREGIDMIEFFHLLKGMSVPKSINTATNV